MLAPFHKDAIRAIVVGDIMLDHYILGSSKRISPEAPVPVVSVTSDKKKLGGAANVAANLTGLGVSCRLFGTIGMDGPGDDIKRLCRESGIDADYIEIEGHCTATKK